ncbi:MAG: hypothetical protein A4E59_01871 [Syntrophorhabdus sp. PtaB.Bin027]|nr:MAG: hypothetical protein A4E59_01871 [Syntrophorhabdus sp. PtaB.Bin027]
MVMGKVCMNNINLFLQYIRFDCSHIEKPVPWCKIPVKFESIKKLEPPQFYLFLDGSFRKFDGGFSVGNGHINTFGTERLT